MSASRRTRTSLCPPERALSVRKLAGLMACALVLACFVTEFWRQGVLGAIQPGDIIVIGFQSDPDDQFAWVPLVNLEPGAEITFSDAGWSAGRLRGSLTTSDGGLVFEVPPGGLPAGKVLRAKFEGGIVPSGYRAGPSAVGPSLRAGAFGDQLAIFTGTVDAPTFIFALNTNSTGWGLGATPNYATESELYPGLVGGMTAVAVGAGPNPGNEYDNSVYMGLASGTRDEILAAVANPSNWNSSNDPLPDITGGRDATGFQITPVVGFRRGDSNDDSFHDISDATRILGRLFLGAAPFACDDAADANDDGQLDISDVIAFLRYLFLGTGSVPPPLDACGPDPTEDALGCNGSMNCR